MERSSITKSDRASEFFAARGLKPKRALIHSMYLSGPRIVGDAITSRNFVSPLFCLNLLTFSESALPSRQRGLKYATRY